MPLEVTTVIQKVEVRQSSANRITVASAGKQGPKGDRGYSAYQVAVVGGGPAGMAVGYFLGRQGAQVTIFEQRAALGGIVRYVIPGFRIGDYGVDR
ncbi:MAG: hypothetical protein EOM17_11555, partial [Synergistales bacterium]|nr:hypothetical protein [Synergistales bacterium]